jgi:hypothetical protein
VRNDFALKALSLARMTGSDDAWSILSGRSRMTREENTVEGDAERARFAALARLPNTLVTGIVSPDGAAATDTESEGVWYVFFSLEPWRLGEGAVIPRRLVLHQPHVLDAAFEPLRQTLAADTIVRLHVKLEAGAATTYGMLVEVLESPAEDVELAALLREALAPVVHEDSQFGRLVWDRAGRDFVGQTSWRGRDVSLGLHVPARDEREGVLACARRLWARADAWEAGAREMMVAQLLERMNEGWLDDDEEPITAAQFNRRVTLTHVSVSEGDGVELLFDDGELFGGHTIIATGTVEGGAEDVSLFG